MKTVVLTSDTIYPNLKEAITILKNWDFRYRRKLGCHNTGY